MRLDYENVYSSTNFYMLGWFERKEEIHYFTLPPESKDNYHSRACAEILWETLVRDVKWGSRGHYTA